MGKLGAGGQSGAGLLGLLGLLGAACPSLCVGLPACLAAERGAARRVCGPSVFNEQGRAEKMILLLAF